MSENLKIGDSYMIIEETDDYIKKTTGTIKDVNKYSISSVEYLLKKGKVRLYKYRKRNYTRTLKVSEGQINKAKLLNTHCFKMPYEKYSDNNPYDILKASLRIKGSIEYKNDMTEQTLIALNRNIKEVWAELKYKYNLNIDCNYYANLEICKVPGTNITIYDKDEEWAFFKDSYDF